MDDDEFLDVLSDMRDEGMSADLALTFAQLEAGDAEPWTLEDCGLTEADLE